MIKLLLRSTLLISSLNIALDATTLTVVTPTDNTSVSGDTDSLAPFGTGDATYQWDFSSSQFSNVPIGSTITSIGFRQSQFDGDAPDIAYTCPDGTFSLVQARMRSDLWPRIFSRTLVRMWLPSAPVHSTCRWALFKDTIHLRVRFSSSPSRHPYVYSGGDLLATLRKKGSTPSTALHVDSITAGSSAFVRSVAQGGYTSTSGTVDFFNIPIAQFTFEAPVSEPAAFALLGSGLLCIASALRRRRAPVMTTREPNAQTVGS